MFLPPTTQQKLGWFNRGEPGPSDEEKAWMVNRDNPECPFHTFIGNDKAVKRLCRAGYAALGDPHHNCADQSFALLGPASTGKTTLAKLFAKLVGLPFVEIHPKAVKNANDILVKIAAVMDKTYIHFKDGHYTNLELCPVSHDQDGKEMPDNYLVLPPMILFLEEVHALPDAIVQALLTATEKKDGIFDTGKWIADCRNVCFIIATTDRGDLFDAFDTRFTKINLQLYTTDEIARIVQVNNPDWDMDVCKIVARSSGRIPREALAFAAEMRLEHEMNKGTWEQVAKTVAEDNDIDELGMTKQRLTILKALADGPVAKARICEVAACKEEELEKFVMPALLVGSEEQPSLVTTTSKGFALTNAGRDELNKRNIPNDPFTCTLKG